jgi:hypothetical protein
MYRKLQLAPCLTKRKAVEIECARNQTHNNPNNREIRDCPVRAAVLSTPHPLYTITIHTNQPVLPTIPTRHTPETHETQTHTKHTSHKSPIIPQPYTIHHTPIAFHTSPYSQSCRNIATPTHHRHTNSTQTNTHINTPHSPKDNLAQHTHNPKPSRSHCLPGILQDPMLTMPFTQHH